MTQLTMQFLHVATMLEPRFKSSYSWNATTTAKETIIMEAIRASTNEADGAETKLFIFLYFDQYQVELMIYTYIPLQNKYRIN